MRFLFPIAMCFSLHSCGTVGEYYYFTEGGKETTISTLYISDEIAIEFMVFNGNISRVIFIDRGDFSNLNIEILKYEHSIFEGGVTYYPKIYENKELVVEIPRGGWGVIASQLLFDKNPAMLTESIAIDLLIGEEPITIVREFHLVRETYNQLEALWGI